MSGYVSITGTSSLHHTILCVGFCIDRFCSPVTHYSEHTLELLVLGSPKVADNGEEILAHLKECHGCKELYEEIAAFYGALSGPEALPEHTATGKTSLRLSPTYGQPIVARRAKDRPAVLTWMRQNRRTVTSAGTFVLVAAVMMFFAIRVGSGIPIAHHAIFDSAKHAALIADQAGNVLFSLPLPQDNPVETYRVINGKETVMIRDIDGDRIPEVITWMPVASGEQVEAHRIRAFRSDGTPLWDVHIGEELSFGSEQYGNHFSINGIALLKRAGSDVKELLVGAAHNHSPFIFYRLSAEGRILGEYRLMGHVMAFIARDVDADESSEVFFAGVIDDGTLKRTMYAGRLEPFSIEGVTQATIVPEPGFGVPLSNAEVTLVRLPETYLRPFINPMYSNVDRIILRQDGNLTLSVNEYLDGSGRHAQWEYLFDRDLMPLKVNATDALRQAHNDLVEKGKISGDLGAEILESHLKRITYWDGEMWSDQRPLSVKDHGAFARELFNPVRAEFHDNGIRLQNRKGRIVGTVELSPEEIQDYGSWARGSLGIDLKVVLTDIDQDGLNEVILYRKGKSGSDTMYTLECRSSDGFEVKWSRPFVFDIRFPGKTDVVSPYYTAGDITADDIDGDGERDIFVVAGNMNMFPCLVMRLDPRSGDVMNSYLHIGHLQRMKLFDLDGDGTKEILLGGIGNSFKEAVFVVLNGSDFSGVSPHTAEYAPEGWEPGNEKAYFRIPRTIVGDQFWRVSPDNQFNTLDMFEPSRKLQAWVNDFQTLERGGEESMASIGVTITFDLKVVGIATGSLFDAIAERMYRQGDLPRKIDQEYWEEYLSGIKQWNGSEWHTQRVKLRKSSLSMQ